jgi:hypothetical protein
MSEEISPRQYPVSNHGDDFDKKKNLILQSEFLQVS